MKTTRSDKWICLLFALFLALMPLLFLLLPKQELSAREKRYLAPAPVFGWEELISGRFAEEAEAYAADHLPGRDYLVGLDALCELVSGRQTTRSVYLCRDGRLCEAPVDFDRERLTRNMAVLRTFAEASPVPVDLMLVPSAGYWMGDVLPALADPYPDDAILDAAYAAAGGALVPVDFRPVFAASGDPAALYYRTDHHWTAEGAYRAAAHYLESLGREALPPERYTVTETPDFRGTAWSRAALWFLPGEELALWDSGGDFTVENREDPGEHAGLFYPEHLTEEDKYPVYLDGNHSLVRVCNRDPAAQGRLLVIRDSFASCFGCFLADAFEEIVLVDLRYYRSPVSELLAEEAFDRVLVLYNVGNFMTDSNLVRLS